MCVCVLFSLNSNRTVSALVPIDKHEPTVFFVWYLNKGEEGAKGDEQFILVRLPGFLQD